MSNISNALLDIFRLPGSVTKQAIGAIIASTTTIALSYPVHHVSGSTAIATITPPGDDFAGFALLIADGAFTFTTAGNIAVTATATAGQGILMFYSPVDTKWYPVKY